MGSNVIACFIDTQVLKLRNRSRTKSTSYKMSEASSKHDQNTVYIGDYNGERNEKGERHGEGITILPNGDRYEGSYKNGFRHGHGTYFFTSNETGARYIGEYKDGKKDGLGIMYYPDGSIYDGQWANNQRTGDGSYTYSNGDKYTGSWLNNKRHGKGIYIYSNKSHSGLVFQGTWANGDADGGGHLLHGKSHVYQGRWIENVMQGPGKYIFSFGAEQHGEYVPVEQDIDDADDFNDDFYNKKLNTTSRWRAKKITSLTVDASSMLDQQI